MFRALLCPSSGAVYKLQSQPPVGYECVGGCVSSRGQFVSAGNTTTYAFIRQPEAAIAVCKEGEDSEGKDSVLLE
jgi:hypothetical protein